MRRCFPSFSANWTSQVVDAAAVGAGAATVDAFKDAFNSASNQWNRYVSSISKGILIVAVGGLVGGIVLSLVSSRLATRRVRGCGAAGLRAATELLVCL